MGIKGLKEAYMFSYFPTQFSSGIQLQKTSGKLVYKPKTKSHQSQMYMFCVQNFFEDDFLPWLTSFCHVTIVSSNSITINLNWIRWAKTFFTCLKNIDNVIHLSINIPGKLSTTFLFFFHTEAVPGNIRQAEHFVNFMRRFIEYLKVCSTLLLPKIFRLISFLTLMYLA